MPASKSTFFIALLAQMLQSELYVEIEASSIEGLLPSPQVNLAHEHPISGGVQSPGNLDL